MRGFVLYQSDGIARHGSTYSDWWRLPKTDIQCVIIDHDDERAEILMGLDEYRLGTSKHVKRGAWMETADFDALIERAMAETVQRQAGR